MNRLIDRYQKQSLLANYTEQLVPQEMALRGRVTQLMPPSWQSYDCKVFSSDQQHWARIQCKHTSDGRRFEFSDFKFDFLVGIRFNELQKARRITTETWVVPVAVCQAQANGLTLSIDRIPDEYKALDYLHVLHSITSMEDLQKLANAFLKDPWQQITHFLEKELS